MFLIILYFPFISSLIVLFARYLGSFGFYFLNSIFNLFLFIFSSILFYSIVFKGLSLKIDLFSWFFTDIINCKYSFILDPISTLLLYLVIIIYIIIIQYSFWYLHQDPYLIRFLSYLNLFCFMMMIFVLSNNFIIMFIGWEGIGLSSFLLINYWFTRIYANKSAYKAILFNKFGDFLFLFSFILILNLYYLLPNLFNDFLFFNKYFNLLLIFGFIFASLIKSAQIPFYGWLSDAMEGPTPVSALLHAATMVTAGIFLLYRILPIFLLDPEIYRYIGYIGIITIIIGGLIGLYQNDIKRIIAFSTCSQLGYMFYSAAIGLYNLSFFHLIIHGFFKSLLFIIAGILIHGNKNEQDIRKYGGYIFSYPLSYIFFFIGTLSITSFPFYSGFYSKDILIENSYFSFFEIYLFSLLGVILTISYSLRILYLIFYNKPNSLPNQILPNDYFSYFWILLSFGSLFLGYLLFDFFFNPVFLSSFSIFPFHSLDFHFLNPIIKLLPVFLSILGILIGLYIDKLSYYSSLTTFIYFYIPFYCFFNKKLFLDHFIYYLLNILLFLSYFFLNSIEKGFLELFGSLGLYRSFSLLFRFKFNPLFLDNNNLNSHKFSNYIFWIFIPISFYFLFFLI